VVFVTGFTSHVVGFRNNGLHRRSVVVGMSVIMVVVWTMLQFAPASAEQGLEPPKAASVESMTNSGGEVPAPEVAPIQGPALTVPEEMVAMFQQRKQDLDRREQAVRTAEGQIAILRAEVEEILTKVEAIEKRRLEQQKTATSLPGTQGKKPLDTRAHQLAQLAKMYESMPAEEAAARLERMPDRKALEILRVIKSKSAGAILAQVKVDRAAKLTEELLATP
jgi:flagellar motility protein MotE (MotC chaperone)